VESPLSQIGTRRSVNVACRFCRLYSQSIYRRIFHCLPTQLTETACCLRRKTAVYLTAVSNVSTAFVSRGNRYLLGDDSLCNELKEFLMTSDLPVDFLLSLIDNLVYFTLPFMDDILSLQRNAHNAQIRRHVLYTFKELTTYSSHKRSDRASNHQAIEMFSYH